MTFSEKQEVYYVIPQGLSRGNESSNCYCYQVIRLSYDSRVISYCGVIDFTVLLTVKMAESSTGLSELTEFLDLNDSNYETDSDVEILDGFYLENTPYHVNDKVQQFASSHRILASFATSKLGGLETR